MKLGHFTLCILAALTGAAFASDKTAALSAQIVVLGEVHDNPGHHARQADWVAQIGPRAVVFEMITKEQADSITPDMRSDPEALAKALNWGASGWPDFAMYFPIVHAAADARLFGAAVPREVARGVMDVGLARAFGDDADVFDLSQPLPKAQQSDREAMQLAAHCDAMPPEMLPVMVQIQRLRDASLARAALAALDQTGGPVIVITGNGHARKDWGAPFLIANARPDVSVFALGQAEDGSGVEGGFDLVLSSPPVSRPDPCDTFQAKASE